MELYPLSFLHFTSPIYHPLQSPEAFPDIFKFAFGPVVKASVLISQRIAFSIVIRQFTRRTLPWFQRGFILWQNDLPSAHLRPFVDQLASELFEAYKRTHATGNSRTGCQRDFKILSQTHRRFKTTGFSCVVDWLATTLAYGNRLIQCIQYLPESVI